MLKFILIAMVVFFPLSCAGKDDERSGCRICGEADRLPADIVSMETMYLSAEFLDVDNDGDMDLALGNWGDTSTPTDRLLLNDGTGHFTDAPEGAMPPKLFDGEGAGATDITLLDVNNDGNIDMVLTSWTTSIGQTKLQLLINDGSGHFTDATFMISDNENSDQNQVHCGWIRTGDFDGDGLTDLMTCVRTWLNTGAGFLSVNQTNFDLELVNRIGGGGRAIADLDGDGLPEPVVLVNINDNFFELGQPEIVGGINSTIALDADTDGDLDLFVAQNDFGSPAGGTGAGDTAFPVKLLINDGLGNFSYAPDTAFTPAPPEFFFAGHISGVADFNGDGRTDIYIQEGGTDREPYPGGQNRILIQKADGTFSDETNQRLPLHNDFSHGVAIGDIDNDGDIDIYNNSISGGDFVSPSLLINDGNGFFTEEW